MLSIPYDEMSSFRILSLIVFVIASLTDALDGYIARKYNLITSFGKLLDPLADKVLVVCALLCLLVTKEVPLIGVLVVVIREFSISSIRLVATEKGIVIAASKMGKIKTISQMISIILILAKFYDINMTCYYITYSIYYISVVFTVLSLVDYVYKNRSVLKDN
jgi:CDP-diacylglycerol--glycerol-3-phosphate 3-phosphatidyltransferase